MKLTNAAKYFDTCQAYDGYSGQPFAKVQTSTFIENSLEGSTSSRRVLSLAPEIALPTHSCLLVLGTLILTGGKTKDEWAGQTIRQSVWTKTVTDSVKCQTPANSILDVATSSVYMQKQFGREVPGTASDAQVDNYWTLYASLSVLCNKGYLIKSGTTLYRVRTLYVDVDGFATLKCDELDEPACDITVTGSQSSYDPITDTFVASSTSLKALPIDFNKVYVKSSGSDVPAAAGDLGLLVPKSLVTPSVGSELTIPGTSKHSGSWRVIKFVDELDTWLLQLRRR